MRVAERDNVAVVARGETNTALIQVLGAIAYGELKAHEGAKAAAAEATTEDERRWHRQVAAEELRHHKGFVKRLEALGARRVELRKRWWVMEAPTGHRFCVAHPQRGPLESRANEWNRED